MIESHSIQRLRNLEAELRRSRLGNSVSFLLSDIGELEHDFPDPSVYRAHAAFLLGVAHCRQAYHYGAPIAGPRSIDFLVTSTVHFDRAFSILANLKNRAASNSDRIDGLTHDIVYEWSVALSVIDSSQPLVRTAGVRLIEPNALRHLTSGERRAVLRAKRSSSRLQSRVR